MNPAVTLTQRQLPDFLLNTAVVRPVFIWGPPGIGKSSIVEQFAAQLGLPCVSLLGTQLAPEDIIGVPQIFDGKSRFCPPTNIAREEPYCLFLDELNACSHEVQKSFYSLIHDRRIAEYELPEGSIVIGAGNRTQDSAIVKQMSSALINRMVHVHLKASSDDWLAWASRNDIYPEIVEYIKLRPDHLWSLPPKHEEPFSTPRSWHILSDTMLQYTAGPSLEECRALAYGCLSPHHAGQFIAFLKQAKNKFELNKILKGEARWPSDPEDRDVLYFLAQSFRAQVIKQLPQSKQDLRGQQKDIAFRVKDLIKELAQISLEIAQMVVTEDDEDDGENLPDWLMVELVRDLPRLIRRDDGNA